MAAIDPLGQRCDRVVRVHIRQLVNLTVGVYEAVRVAQSIYGRYGVYFQVASVQALQLDPEVRAELAVVETACMHGESSPRQSELYEMYGVQDFASITAFFIQSIVFTYDRSVTTLGCAAHAPHQPAVFISHQAVPWVLAHEVGHVLLRHADLAHSAGRFDLMREGGTRTASELRQVFSMEQIDLMRRSPHCLPC